MLKNGQNIYLSKSLPMKIAKKNWRKQITWTIYFIFFKWILYIMMQCENECKRFWKILDTTHAQWILLKFAFRQLCNLSKTECEKNEAGLFICGKNNINDFWTFAKNKKYTDRRIYPNWPNNCPPPSPLSTKTFPYFQKGGGAIIREIPKFG